MEEECSRKLALKEDEKENGGRFDHVHFERSQLPELLRVYYMWLFPYDKYHEWLQYGERKEHLLVLCHCVTFSAFPSP